MTILDKVELGRLDRSPRANWVEKRGGLPDYIDRIAVHVHEKGFAISNAIQVAIQAVKHWCATGEVYQWRGTQIINPGSVGEACAAVAQWEAMKGSSGGGGSKKTSMEANPEILMTDDELIRELTGELPDEQEVQKILMLSRGQAESMEDLEAKLESGRLHLSQPLTELAWNGDASRFTDEQYRRSCLIVNGQSKSECHLPVREPNGTLNCDGVSAAASRIGQTQASPEQKKAAAKKLVSLMRNACKQEPSSALLSMAGMSGGSDSSGSSGGSQKNMSARFKDWLTQGLAFFGEPAALEAMEADGPPDSPEDGALAPFEADSLPEGVVTLAYQLPVTELKSEKVGKRRFRRPILPVGQVINYEKGGVKKTLKFTAEYVDKMIANLRAKAFSQIPLLALHPESKAVNPEHYFGEMVDAERDDKWVYGVFDVTERCVKALADNPKLPVSVGIFEDYFRKADKKLFKGPSLQHVAFTYTPYLPSLGEGWAPVAMSEAAEAAEVVDLTGTEFAAPQTLGKESGPVSEAPTSTNPGEGVTTEAVTKEQLEQLQAELAAERVKREALELSAGASQKMLREQGIAEMLRKRTSFAKDGKRYAVPTAKLDAFKVVLDALEASGSGAIELSAAGASTNDTEVGKAMDELLTPWEPVALGEEGSGEIKAAPDDPEEAISNRVSVLMSQDGLDADAAFEKAISEAGVA